MRLFVAISLPDSVKQRLGGIIKPIRGVRWQDASNMHLTLRFIGDLEQEPMSRLRELLAGISRPSFTMTIHGLGSFPKRGYPRVIWAGVERKQVLMDLQNDVEMACRETGLEPEQRSFIPHITLGRVNDASRDEVITYIKSLEDFEVNNIPVDAFTLNSSELRSGGAVHTPLQTYPLE